MPVTAAHEPVYDVAGVHEAATGLFAHVGSAGHAVAPVPTQICADGTVVTSRSDFAPAGSPTT